MEVRALDSFTNTLAGASARPAAGGLTQSAAPETVQVKTIPKDEMKVDKPDFKQEIKSDEIDYIAREMTKFMQTLDADIQFSLHEGTKQLVVKVVDNRDGRVLKEFPPKEFLDTIAAIREYVGILIDRKV